MVQNVRKRDGIVVKFDKEKIVHAIWNAAKAVGGHNKEKAADLAEEVYKTIYDIYDDHIVPDVEEIQDIVEKVLIENGHAKTAKAYILYRQERSALREQKMLVMEKDNLDDVDKE